MSHTFTKFKLHKPRPPPTPTQALERRADYVVPWNGKLRDVRSWTLQSFERKFTRTSVLDRKRALEFIKYGVEVTEDDGLFVVTFGGMQNVFVEVETGEAAVAISSGIVELIKQLKKEE